MGFRKSVSRNEKIKGRAGVMVQQLRALAALAKDLGSVPSAHTVQLTTTTCNIRRGLTPLASVGIYSLMHVPHTQTHTHIIKNNKIHILKANQCLASLTPACGRQW